MSSCAHYRLVEVGQQLHRDSLEKEVSYYAIAKNNVVVPEYVIDAYGEYPTVPERAWEVFSARQALIDSLVDRKYVIPNTAVYQTQRIFFMIGLIAVAPVSIPIMYVSERSLADEHKRGFKQVTHDYFALSVSEPLIHAPVIKDAFVDIPLVEEVH